MILKNIRAYILANFQRLLRENTGENQTIEGAITGEKLTNDTGGGVC
jgi:hypothetical protein